MTLSDKRRKDDESYLNNPWVYEEEVVKEAIKELAGKLWVKGMKGKIIDMVLIEIFGEELCSKKEVQESQ